MTQAVELYEFRNNSEVYYITSASTTITYLGMNYTPTNIQREKILQTTDPLREPINLTFPRSDSFASRFISYEADSQFTVTIYRGTLTGSTWAVTYKGRVVEAVGQGNLVKLNCESLYTTIQNDGLQARYEYNCRHLLYGSQCGADPNSFKVNGTVLSNSGTVIEVVAADALADGYFTGGILQDAFLNRRYILSHVGANLTLSRSWATLPVGAAVVIYAGCDRTKATCNTKFSNVINFGGFPWIPSQNPFNGSIV